MSSSTPSEPQHARLFSVLRGTALAATAAAYVLTVLLVPPALAREQNPAIQALLPYMWDGLTTTQLAVRWTLLGLIALAIVALLLDAWRQLLPDYPRLSFGAVVGIAAVSVLDASVNLYVLFQAGLPESLWLEAFGPPIAAVATAGFVAAVGRRRLAAGARRVWSAPSEVSVRRGTGRSVVVVVTAVLVTVVIIGPFASLGVIDSSHDGVAAAAETSAGGVVYVGDSSSTIKAVDSSTGDVEWENDLPPTGQVGGMEVGPNGVLYVTTADGDGTVTALDTADGSVIWNNTDGTSDANEEGRNLAVGPNGDVVYVAAWNKVKALDTGDGSEKWSTSASSSSAVTISPDGNTVYASDDSTLRGYDPADGSTTGFSYGASGTVIFEAVVEPDGGALYLSTNSPTVEGVDLSDGSGMWSYSSSFTGPSARSVDVTSDNASVVSGDTDGVLVKIDTGSGGEVWSKSLANQTNEVQISGDDSTVSVTLSGNSDNVRQRDMTDGSSISTYTESAGQTELSYVYSGVGGDIVGQVVDQNGDPVVNATVYTADWSTSDPPQITTNRDLREIQEHPFPSGWDSQLDMPGVGATTIEPSDVEWTETRVLLHTTEDWELQGPNMGRSIWEYVLMDDNEPRSEIVNPEVALDQPRTTISPDDSGVLTCWRFSEGSLNPLDRPDSIDEDIEGAETTACSMVIEKVDPIDGTISQRTEDTHPFVEYDSRVYEVGVDDKTHEAVAWRPSQGIYKVYPEDSSENAMYYVVAPDADPENHKVKIANVAESKEEAISAFNERMQEEYDAGNLDIASTTTNASGYYGLFVQTPVNETDVIAVKPGPTREDMHSDIEGVTEANFRAASPTTDGLTSDVWTQPEFEQYCRDMDTVMEETGMPFEGHERNVKPPNDNVDIHGVRAVPQDLNGEVSECFVINTVQAILEDGLAGLFPGFQDDLSALPRAELEARYSQLMAFIEGTPELETALEERTDGDLDAILNDDPSDLSRGELEARISDGMESVESGGSPTSGGGGGGFAGGGSSSPSVSPPDASTGNETLNAVWQVGNVDDWSDASLLARIHYSNGSTTMLNESSEYVSIDESVVGSDTVRLEEYPLGETDPATVRVELDVATPEGSTGDPDSPGSVVRNPTFDGDIPALRDMRVSNLAPGPSDNVTIDVTPRENARFGQLLYANVSHPECSYSTTAQDEALDVWTCGEGSHHVSVTFSNPGGTEFVETFQLDAKAAAQSRPATVRSRVGPVGRYAMTNGQLRGGDIQTRDGASVVEVIAIAEPGDIPNNVVASTTGMDVAKDSDTVVRVVEGDAQQTVRKRIGVILHRDSPSDAALLYRNGRAVPSEGESTTARINASGGTLTMDSFTDETGEVTLRVNGDPDWLDRIRHWASLNVPLLSLSMSGDTLLLVTPFVVYYRRRKRPPNTGGGGEVTA